MSKTTGNEQLWRKTLPAESEEAGGFALAVNDV